MRDVRALDDTLHAATASGAIPGLVAIATRSSETIYDGAFGVRDLSTSQPMTRDSVFWIASMTKAITTVAALQLVEQDRLRLDSPIADILPDFASPMVMDGLDDTGAPRLRPAKGAITLRHLMTHTAGFCYDMWNADMLRYMKATGLPRPGTGQRIALTAPLAFDPGTRWEYGINIDVIGLMIERASGQRLDRYLRDHLFAPLGMSDTAFHLSQALRERLVRVHARAGDGTLAPIDFECEQQPEMLMGGGGLYSTASDYARFARMILKKGVADDGSVILKPDTVASMARNQIGDLEMGTLPTAIPHLTHAIDFHPGIVKKWGLGFMINMAETPEGRSVGSLAWAGLSNCYYWIDPARDVAGIILMQVLPFADPICLDAFSRFERGVYETLAASKAASSVGSRGADAAPPRDSGPPWPRDPSARSAGVRRHAE